ncbi:MAG: 30S ribosomal protein S6 [Microbacteriaceae bacterium]|nr:MAG: 30S ribosomal protein S6 [Microbacteriaceae bacterium]
MHQYELMVILDPEIDERTVAPSLDKFLNVIRNDGGTVEKVDIWGRRRLAYEINKKAEGIYAVVDFTANATATAELDRQLKLSEAVMRTKVLRAEDAIAQVATAAKLAEEKAARKRRPEPVEGPAPAKAAAAAKAAAPAPVAAVAKAAEKASA